MTRFIVALAMLLSSISASRAETLQEAVVTLLKDVCLDAATHETQLERAQNIAGVRGWTELVRKAPAAEPPVLEGPGVSSFKAWEFDLVGTAQARLWVAVFGLPSPDAKYHVCAVDVPIAPFYQELGAELERQLGSRLPRKKEFSGSTSWVFSGRLGQEADCRETIALLPVAPRSPKPTSLMFTDLSYFKNEKWQAAMPQAWCQS